MSEPRPEATIRDTATLRALIARVEAAQGADTKLDKAIHGALGYCLHPHTKRDGYQSDTGFTCTTCGADSWGNKGPRGETLYSSILAYTASLDAALTLVPEGFAWTCYGGKRDEGHATAYCIPKEGRYHWPSWVTDICAATPELALTAAGLTAQLAVLENW